MNGSLELFAAHKGLLGDRKVPLSNYSKWFTKIGVLKMCG